MPSRPLAPCRRPGCPHVTRDPSGYCGRCIEYGKAQQKERMARKQGHPFYKTLHWKRLRLWYLGRHPLCESCGRAKATEVDHIVELQDGGPAMSIDNLRALCHSCHMRKTAAERRRRERQG